MNLSAFEAAVGGLLHDLGKIACRAEGRCSDHRSSGIDILRGFDISESVLDCIKYDDGDTLTSADIAGNSAAYAVFLADVIASNDIKVSESGGDSSQPLTSVFGTMKGAFDQLGYPISVFDGNNIIAPSNELSENNARNCYNKILNSLTSCLAQIKFNKQYFDSLLSIVEKHCSFMPYDTSKNKLHDISLYDHLKLTSALAACISEYCLAENIADLKKELFEQREEFCRRKTFLLYSCDISGIQSFIYNISSSGALKSLRSRSFALEMLMEHFIDEVIEGCGMTRANLIYSGGGHCYILLPNTERSVTVCDKMHKAMKSWLMQNFGTSLYMASAYCECSANELINKADGGDVKSPYSEVFISLSRKLSAQKLHRYTADDLKYLNTPHARDRHRECSVCGRSDRLVKAKDGKSLLCSLCDMFVKIGSVITSEELIMPVTHTAPGENVISWELPTMEGRVYLSFIKGDADKFKKAHDDVLRIYCKNKIGFEQGLMRNVYVGDYVYDRDISSLADAGEGIGRISICRMDVDDLGKAFISGFETEGAESDVEKYKNVSLSRTSAFSGKMSIFFRYYINLILKKEKYKLNIVYSGGDDVFLVGHWNDIIRASLDIIKSFNSYCGGALTISGGIGMFDAKFPISIGAEITAELEDTAKLHISAEGKPKNAVDLFAPYEMNVFGWDELEQNVLNEKLGLIKQYIEYKKQDKETKEHGNTMLYKILELLRKSNDKINIARFAYMLARLRPSDKEKNKDYFEEYNKLYKKFSKAMYSWASDETDRKQLIMAITIYVYMNRRKSN